MTVCHSPDRISLPPLVTLCMWYLVFLTEFLYSLLCESADTDEGVAFWEELYGLIHGHITQIIKLSTH